MNNRVVKNATWIIVCKIVQSVLALIINMMTARFLGPSNYGVISYAASIIAFILPATQLGLSNILVQEFTNKPEEEGTILGTAMLMNAVSSIAGMFSVAAFVLLTDYGNTITILVCIIYSLTLFFQSLELIQYWYQYKLLSKYASVVSLIAYIFVAGYKTFLLLTQKDVTWFAFSNSIDYALISITLILIYKRLGGGKLHYSFETAKRMFSKSKHYILSTMMVVIYAQTDKIMLKFFINEEATGLYTAAVTTAGVSMFVFSAIIDSLRPVIFDYKRLNNEEKYNESLVTLYSIIIYLALIQNVLMTIFAGLIIKVLYGDGYSASAAILQVVVWYTTFSYLGLVRNIWMLGENKQKYLWVINLSGAAMNIVINAVLIPSFGIMGAAIASLITQLFVNVIIGFIIKPIRENNSLMIKGLNPLKLKDVFKKMFKH